MRRFLAHDFKTALRLVREAMGEDAVILSHRSVPEGVELVATANAGAMDVQKSNKRLNASGKPHSPQKSAPKKEKMESQGAEYTSGSSDPLPKDAFARLFERTEQKEESPIAEPTVNILPPKMQSIEQEVRSMRRMLEAQTAAFAWGRFVDRNRDLLPLIQEIAKTGLSLSWIEHFLSNLSAAGTPSLPAFAERLAATLTIDPEGLPNEGGVIAFFGPTGAGKTSVLMKLVAHLFREYGPGDIALLSIDAAKLGSGEQLRLFARALGIPVMLAHDEDEMRQQLALWRHKKFVFVDTFGMHAKSHLGIQTLAMLASNRYLVLPANLHQKSFNKIAQVSAELKPTGLIATKLDEVLSLGPLLNFLLDSRLPLAYCTAGQNIPEDIRKANAVELVRLAFALSYDHDDGSSDDTPFLFDTP